MSRFVDFEIVLSSDIFGSVHLYSGKEKDMAIGLSRAIPTPCWIFDSVLPRITTGERSFSVVTPVRCNFVALPASCALRADAKGCTEWGLHRGRKIHPTFCPVWLPAACSWDWRKSDDSFGVILLPAVILQVQNNFYFRKNHELYSAIPSTAEAEQKYFTFTEWTVAF